MKVFKIINLKFPQLNNPKVPKTLKVPKIFYKMPTTRLPAILHGPLYVLLFGLITSGVVLGLTTLWYKANPPVAYTTENLNVEPKVETEVVFVDPPQGEEVRVQTPPPPDVAASEVQKAGQEAQATVAKPSAEAQTASSAPDLTKMEHPIQGQVSLGFQFAYSEIYHDYRLHPGFDYSAQEGSKVLAALEGVVGSIEPSSEGGYIVTLKHGEGWETSYTALETELKVNQYVPQGGLLGRLVGAVPGEMDSGSHLHFELRKDGKAINPNEYLR
jgi:murein DD-endopeptidase MepM/ murein hydrolase activator NlpD